MDRIGQEWAGLNKNKQDWTGLDRIVQDWTRINMIGQDWTGLDKNKQDWTGLDKKTQDWTRLDRIFNRRSFRGDERMGWSWVEGSTRACCCNFIGFRLAERMA